MALRVSRSAPGLLDRRSPQRRGAETFGVPWRVVPVTRGLKPGAGADAVVLARRMQGLSGDFVRGVGGPVVPHPPCTPRDWGRAAGTRLLD